MEIYLSEYYCYYVNQNGIHTANSHPFYLNVHFLMGYLLVLETKGNFFCLRFLFFIIALKYCLGIANIWLSDGLVPMIPITGGTLLFK